MDSCTRRSWTRLAFILIDPQMHPKPLQDPASRINAAVAVACLVGHEEGNPRLQLDESLVGEMLEVLDEACAGAMRHGIFWTVWKLCQGLASLSVNDKNKELITMRVRTDWVGRGREGLVVKMRERGGCGEGRGPGFARQGRRGGPRVLGTTGVQGLCQGLPSLNKELITVRVGTVGNGCEGSLVTVV